MEGEGNKKRECVINSANLLFWNFKIKLKVKLVSGSLEVNIILYSESPSKVITI